MLRCPRCRLVFADYTGCAALKCQHEDFAGRKIGGCNAAFCALCQLDCGNDAHRHVANCPLNTTGGVHIAADVFQRVVQGERRRKLPEYWGTLKPQVQVELAANAGIRQVFVELGLPPPLSPPGYAAAAGGRSGGGAAVVLWAAEVAQLRGLFPGVGVELVRVAVEENGGDVDAAAGLLAAAAGD